ncbi:MAG: DNA primase [Deltaproteobacteria bacterium]|nr:DNA primase [Deltaproteobacteria bacterium]
MAIYISEDKISEIKNTVDIVDIISDVVTLKKAGKNYIGLCPFHSEKTPSFTVSPEKKIFHCFGCQAGGNVFTFMMKNEGISFPEAVRIIAAKCGINIPAQRLSQDQKRKISEREKLLDVNRQAMNYFSNILLSSSTGKIAKEYLKKRKITKDIIKSFAIGYAQEGWDNLISYFFKKKISPRLLEKSGLIIPRRKGNGFYDRFRGRIIFPIFNISSQVIGFGGRVLDDSDPKNAKYLNSPETPVYTKSHSLYGLNRAKDKLRELKTVFVVEGYFDLLALHQHDIVNSVATLGTSLTAEHVRLIRGYIGKTGKVILVYDSDDAGLKAAYRSIEIFDKGYVDAKIMVLPDGYDPDSYLFKLGQKSFLKEYSKAKSIMAFLIDFSEKKHGDSIEGKIQIISDMKKPLSDINDSVARSLYVKELAERLDIDESAILEKVREERTVSSDQLRKKNILSVSQGGGLTKKESRIERQIIAMMLQYPEILPELNKRNILEYFENDTLKSIGQKILIYTDKNGINAPDSDSGHGIAKEIYVSEIINLIDDKEKKSIIAALAFEEELWQFEGCIKLITQFIEIRQNSRNKSFIEKQIKEAEKKNDHKLLLRLLGEKQNMAVLRQKEKIALQNRRIREA